MVPKTEAPTGRAPACGPEQVPKRAVPAPRRSRGRAERGDREEEPHAADALWGRKAGAELRVLVGVGARLSTAVGVSSAPSHLRVARIWGVARVRARDGVVVNVDGGVHGVEGAHKEEDRVEELWQWGGRRSGFGRAGRLVAPPFHCSSASGVVFNRATRGAPGPRCGCGCPGLRP